MEVLRTPDHHFENLPDYPFQPKYVDLDGIRMHFVDEGAGEETILLLHGEPSWSFLYRKMIPLLVAAGYRVVAPDLIGFGRSDKPTAFADYSYLSHVNWMKSFLQKTALKDITLFCQDWGGLIGLRILAEDTHLFKRVVAANTFLPTGAFDLGDAFRNWQTFAKTTPTLDIGKLINKATVTALDEAVIAAYNAPFPDETYKAGARIFPELVPNSIEDPASGPNIKAWEKLSLLDIPFLTLFSDQDPITKGGDRLFQKLIPSTKGLNHQTIKDGGHFLQEDKGEEIATHIIEFVNNH